MLRQSEFKRKYNPEMGKYMRQHIYGEGIIDSVKSFFKKTQPPQKPPPKPPVQKKVTFEPSTIVKEKKAGDKIVKILSHENPTTTKTKRKMTEKEYNQYLENLRKLYNY